MTSINRRIIAAKRASFALLLVTMIFGAIAPRLAAIETYAIAAATGPHNNASSTDRMLGWIFTANQSIDVTKLGVWDAGADGLLASHTVGIWNSSGGLLGSTTVLSGVASPSAGATIQGGIFRYQPVTAIHLNAGSQYVVAGLFNDNDEFIFEATSVTAVPQITYITERFSANSSGFVFPTDTGGRPGLFGTNFAFGAVPEPATFGLVGIALAMSMSVRRRTKQ
jgi:hypothetical protein